MFLKNKKIILSAIVILFFLLLSAPVLVDAVNFTPNVTIPGSEFKANATTTVTGTLLGRYINAWYKFGVGIAGILAVLMIAYGGVVWLFSGGASEKISHAKELIAGAVIGLLLALGSYLILNTINPALVNLEIDSLIPVSEISLSGVCKDLSADSKFKCIRTDSTGCDARDDVLNNRKNAQGEDVGGVAKNETECGKVYQYGSGQTCQGFSGCGNDSMCAVELLTTLRTAVYQKDQPLRCIETEEVCERISDNVTGFLNLSDGQMACNTQNIPSELGGCLWIDTPVGNDGCVFFSQPDLKEYCQGKDSCASYDHDAIRLSTHIDAFCINDICSVYNNRTKLSCKVNPDANDTKDCISN